MTVLPPADQLVDAVARHDRVENGFALAVALGITRRLPPGDRRKLDNILGRPEAPAQNVDPAALIG